MSVFTLPQENWTAVTGRVARAEGPVAWAWIAFRNPNTGNWEPVGVCVRGATTAEKRVLRYPSVVISTEQLSPRAAAKRLRDGRVGSAGVIGKAISFGVQGQTRFTPQWMTSERDHGWNLIPLGWPQYFLFHSGIDPAATVQVPWQEPLYALGMPFYPSVRDAVAELVYGVSATEIQLAGGSAHVLIRLPDRRARIHPASYLDGSVRVAIEEGVPGGVHHCVLRAAWRQEASTVEWCHRDVRIDQPGDFDVETGEVPAEMWMILASPEGQLLDRYGWGNVSVLEPEQTGDLAALVERWVQDGEGQRLEFKQELDEEKTKLRFARTVAAFANGYGGVIPVGIGDEGQVVGWNRPKAADRITNIVREHVTEYVSIEITTVEVRGCQIHVVRVPASDIAAKPYRCDDVVMIRVNGTTRKATTWEIQQLARQAQGDVRDSMLPFLPQ